MELIGFLIKAYIVVLMLRDVMTRQELYFNPTGKFIASLTEPIFGTVLKSIPKEKSDKYIPIFIVVLGVLYGVIVSGTTGNSIPVGMFTAFHEIAVFLMLFYMISVILGSFVNTYGASVYTMFFHRIGLFWVKLARGFINISGNKIIIPTVLIIFIAFVIIDGILWAGLGAYTGQLDPVTAGLTAVKVGLLSMVSLLSYLKWLIIIRVLMTWVSPDPRNPIVQLIGSLTDPIMEPFRKIIPPLGMIDISPIILIFLLEFVHVFLTSAIKSLI